MKGRLSLLAGWIMAISLLLIGSSTWAGEFVVDEHTVALWHFNEGEGDVLYDSSPNHNDGTIYGTQWTDGKFGKALEFDGVDDSIEIPYSSDLDPRTHDWTVEGWGLTWDGNSSWAAWVMCYNSDYSQCWWVGPWISGPSEGKLEGLLYDGSTEVLIKTAGYLIQPGLWYYFALVRRGSSVELWLNGKLIESDNFSSLADVNPTRNVQIGGDHQGDDWGSHWWLNGKVDEVRISNVARTAEEIKAHWDQAVVTENIGSIIEEIESLTELTQGEQKSLTTKLDTTLARVSEATDAYEAGKTNVAVNQLTTAQNILGAFINEINAKIKSGKIDKATGNELIEQIQKLIDLLEQLKVDYLT